MSLIIGKFTLNEDTSELLFNQMKRHQKEMSGKEITFDECQRILIECDFRLGWIIEDYPGGEVDDVFEIDFYASSNKRNSIDNSSYELGSVESETPENERSWVKYLLERDIIEGEFDINMLF